MLFVKLIALNLAETLEKGNTKFRHCAECFEICWRKPTGTEAAQSAMVEIADKPYSRIDLLSFCRCMEQAAIASNLDVYPKVAEKCEGNKKTANAGGFKINAISSAQYLSTQTGAETLDAVAGLFQ